MHILVWIRICVFALTVCNILVQIIKFIFLCSRNIMACAHQTRSEYLHRVTHAIKNIKPYNFNKILSCTTLHHENFLLELKFLNLRERRNWSVFRVFTAPVAPNLHHLHHPVRIRIYSQLCNDCMFAHQTWSKYLHRVTGSSLPAGIWLISSLQIGLHDNASCEFRSSWNFGTSMDNEIHAYICCNRAIQFASFASPGVNSRLFTSLHWMYPLSRHLRD